ncbi:MAG: glycosyltransferase, partial [Arthrospira sp. SH-MAG29]
VHLSKPRIPNIVLGLLYKLVWGARVIVDIDDEELAFVKAEATVDWRELPPLRDLDSQEWTEIAAGLAQEFDKVRELDGAEAGELLAAVVAEVLAMPGCGVSQGLGLLLQGLPAVESVKSELGDKGKIEQGRADDGLSGYFAYHRLGEALEELGRFDEAIEAYRRSVELQPEAAGSILSWSRVLRRVGRFDEAQLVRSRLTVAVSQVTSEGFDSADVQGNGHRDRVDIKLREKHDFSPGEISKLLNPLYHWYLKIDKNPDNYWLYWRLGNALVNQNLLDNGLIFYKIGLKINPNSYELNLQLGKVLLLQNKLDRVLVYLTKAQKLEPKSFEVNLNLAWALEKLNRFDEAVLCYQKALTVSPGNYFAIKQLAKIWESEGKHQEAIELYREVLERGYGNLGNDGCSDIDAVGTGFNKSVLFALHLSWPYEGTGYAVRSQHILKSLRGHGLKVLAATRWGYPQNLPEYRSRSIPAWDESEKIRYCRLGIGENDLSEHDWSYELIEQYAEGLVELAGSHQAMVIHGSSTFVNGLAAVLAARKLGVKSVYEIRGLWHLSRVSREPEFRNSYEYAYQQMMEENVARQADAVVVLSEVLKERVVSWGVSSDKITVVPNAVDLKEFYPREADSDLQEQFGLAGKFVIGFLGSLNGYEGVDVLIEAVKGLVAQGYEIVLMVVGGGLALKDLQALGVSVSGKENIIFTGRVPFSQMLDYYSVCDLCVFPRRNDEVCRYVPPLKVLEPMAMEKPVIVSNLPPLVEMVEDEKTGLVFRCGDVEGLMSQILRVYRDEELRRGLGREARSWVERYRSWDEVSRRYLGVYESLFAVRSR